MLYASTLNTLLKSLGKAHFTDRMHATSQKEVTREGYAEHLKQLAAPKPTSQRENELAEIAEATKRVVDDYQANDASRSHMSGAAVGYVWSGHVKEAFKQLAVEESSNLLVVVSTIVVLDKLAHRRSG